MANSTDNYDEYVERAITALQRPSSFLLFILMVILTIEVANVWEYNLRQKSWGGYLESVENNRASEMREAGETIRELSRRLEEAKRPVFFSSANVMEGMGYEKDCADGRL